MAKAPKMTAQDRKWQAECDLRTLACAAEIKANRQRLSAAQAMARKQANALQKISGSAKGKRNG